MCDAAIAPCNSFGTELHSATTNIVENISLVVIPKFLGYGASSVQSPAQPARKHILNKVKTSKFTRALVESLIASAQCLHIRVVALGQRT